MATSAGLAGADRATSARPDAGALNPAALLPGEDAWLGFSGGNGGSQADGSAAAYLTLPLLDDLSTALAWSTVLGSAGPGFMEQNLGLGAGLALSPGWSLGLRGSWHSIRDQLGLSSGAQGFSADAGLRYERALNRTHKLGLGYWGTQLASEWSDPRWKRTVPQVHHLGASWTWKRLASLHLGYELTQGSAVAQSGEEVEVGLASEAWKRFQARAGVALGARGARFGAGASQAWRGKRWRATGHLGAFRQSEDWLVRLQVDLGLTVRKQSAVLAMPLQLTYEPGTRRVQSATLAVNSLEVRPDAQEWELEIRDKDGRVIRVLRGTGTPPALITWDGRDALGEAVEDGDEVTYKLSIKTPNSVQSQTFDLDLRGGLDDSSLSELGADDGPLAEPLLDGEGKLFALLIRPPNLGPDTQRWELIVLDKGRQELYRSEGAGPFPPKLQWNGKDKQGRDRLHEAGLRLRFNAYDSQGRLSTTETELNAGLQPLEEEADAPLPRLGLRIAAFREGGPALALMGSDSSLALLPEEADPGLEATPQATPEPTPEPSAGPAPEPAPEPLLNEPTPLSSPEPTVLASVEPTPQPKATEEAAAAPALAAGLTAPKLEVAPALPPAFMTRAQAEGTSSQKPRPRSGRRAIKRPPLDTLLDIFKPNSAVVDEAKASDKLQAFYWRLQPYKARRLLLTGLVGPGEDGGEALSRQRVRALSQLMVEEGGFEGEFILKVNGSAGQEKGVRVEVLKR